MPPRDHYAQRLEALHASCVPSASWSSPRSHGWLGAFSHHDTKVAERVVTDGPDIDHAQYTLEEGPLITVIATQQPVARDLRRLIAAIAIASELERIGDYAKSIAKIVIRDVEQPPLEPPMRIMQMAERALAMLNEALEAFYPTGCRPGAAIGAASDQVDALDRQVRGSYRPASARSG